MPSDDRDRNFENALAGHLRTGSAAGDRLSACVDAETLAAYHEGSLDPLQIAFVKTHVSDCARCQEILASLQVTDEIPFSATEVAQPETVAASSNIRLLPAARKSMPLWRWVAPAGALAAALLVWVAVHDNGPLQLSPPAPRVAARQDQAASTVPESAPTLPPSPIDATQMKKSVVPDALQATNPAPSPKITNLPLSSRSLAKQKDSAPAREKSSATAEEANQFADALPPTAGARTFSPGAVSQTVTIEPAKPETTRNELAQSKLEGKEENGKRDALFLAPTPKPAPPTASARAAGAPAVVPSQSQTVEVTSEAARASGAGVSGGIVQQQQMEGRSRFDDKTQLRLARSVGAITVSAPDGNVSWRIGQAGVIEFSPDAGKTWVVQPSGVITDLLAGSAPSAKVCWLVGSAGTILRTTDGGKHWFKINPPSQEDLRSVFAVDASQATVSLAGGSYQTTDGGSTWNKLPPQ
jgi:hypothetical protein